LLVTIHIKYSETVLKIAMETRKWALILHKNLITRTINDALYFIPKLHRNEVFIVESISDKIWFSLKRICIWKIDLNFQFASLHRMSFPVSFYSATFVDEIFMIKGYAKCITIFSKTHLSSLHANNKRLH
jgi:hypothetical protein